MTSTTDTETTILEQAETAFASLNYRHPDGAISELEALVERIGAEHPDAEIIQDAIRVMENFAAAIAEIETTLKKHGFTFGRVQEDA